MGFQRDERLVGIHVNFPAGIAGEGSERTPEESQWLADTAAYMTDGGGYIAIQGSRPQTLAYGLHDSPVGQLAWILEKWRAWSDCAGVVESVFTKDELLVNATIYWVTGTMRSSTQWYWAHAHRPPAAVRPVRIECPTGVARFPRDVMQVPRSAAERKYDLRRWTESTAAATSRRWSSRRRWSRRSGRFSGRCADGHPSHPVRGLAGRGVLRELWVFHVLSKPVGLVPDWPRSTPSPRFGCTAVRRPGRPRTAPAAGSRDAAPERRRGRRRRAARRRTHPHCRCGPCGRFSQRP